LAGGDPERELAQHCHYAGHLDAVKARLTVVENLTFWSSYLGGGPENVVAALAALALSDLAEVSAAYLSAGQRRRLGLARLLVAQRPIWLLDEPTVSLDRESTAAFAELVEKHRAGGGMVIAATHVELGLGNTRSLRLFAPERAAA
jgi:heme exporter protein A